MSRVVAVLEVAWGGRTGHWFKINPYNYSGSRLYEMLGHEDLLVTNACPQIVRRPDERGTPDPRYLNDNLQKMLPFSLLLVCGDVAKKTLAQCRNQITVRTLFMPHPANRSWTKSGLEAARLLARRMDRGEGPVTAEITTRGMMK